MPVFRSPLHLILLASAGALAAALTAQYGFGLRPCILCLYQRVPYVVAAILALAGLAGPRAWRGHPLLLALCGLVFLADTGISSFHVGVEQHWWAGLAACTGEGQAVAGSVEDLKAMLAGPPPPRCDQIPWSLFGISMAGYDVFATFALAAFSAWGWANARTSR